MAVNVYVDACDIQLQRGGHQSAHCRLFCEDEERLRAMVRAIGAPRNRARHEPTLHWELGREKQQAAIHAGAIVVSRAELTIRMRTAAEKGVKA